MITVALLIANLGLFLVELSMGDDLASFVRRWGLVSSDVLAGEGVGSIITLLTSTFLHAGWLHLLSNLVYLAVFGAGVERRLGAARFALLYLGSGLVGNVAHLIAQPTSTVPAIGASGAIAGVIAAHLVLFPGATLGTLAPVLFFQAVENAPALALLVLWLLAQLFSGVVAAFNTSVGIAWWAHLGGFLSGLLMAPFLRTRSVTRR